MDDVLHAYNRYIYESPLYSKMLSIILDRNYAKMENELLFNDFNIMMHNVANVVNSRQRVKSLPILFTLMNSQWNKATKLFYHSIIHFDEYHKLDKTFVKEYLSHPNIVASSVKHEVVLKSPYFVNKRTDWLFGSNKGLKTAKRQGSKGKKKNSVKKPK